MNRIEFIKNIVKSGQELIELNSLIENTEYEFRIRKEPVIMSKLNSYKAAYGKAISKLDNDINVYKNNIY